jgi:hypothetical protein
MKIDMSALLRHSTLNPVACLSNNSSYPLSHPPYRVCEFHCAAVNGTAARKWSPVVPCIGTPRLSISRISSTFPPTFLVPVAVVKVFLKHLFLFSLLRNYRTYDHLKLQHNGRTFTFEAISFSPVFRTAFITSLLSTLYFTHATYPKCKSYLI